MSDQSRRKLLKSIAAGSGAVIAGKSLPENWTKPVVDSVMLPAHAETSPTPPVRTLVATIDLDAAEPGGGGPHSFAQALPAGNFEIIPTSGGIYGDAWNRWGFVSGDCSGGQDCSNGWNYEYDYSSTSLGNRDFGLPNSYFDTEARALAEAQAAPVETFTLPVGETVTFELDDTPYTDNQGGIRLQIFQVA